MNRHGRSDAIDFNEPDEYIDGLFIFILRLCDQIESVYGGLCACAFTF